jgi:hypothetical protein
MPYGTEFRTALSILFVDDDEAFGVLVKKNSRDAAILSRR